MAFTPEIRPEVRTVVYFVGAFMTLIVALVLAVVSPLWPEHLPTVSAIALGVAAAWGTLSSNLGVAYRPTAVPPSTADYVGQHRSD